MLLLVTLACFVGASLAQNKCCTPDEWEGNIHSLSGWDDNGTPKWATNEDRVHYDYREKKYAYFHETHYADGSRVGFRSVSDFNTGKYYFIAEDSCTEYDLNGTEMRRECVHDDADFMGTIYYGPHFAHLEADRWVHRMKDSDGNDVGGSYHTYARFGCIPVAHVDFVEDGNNARMSGSHYTDIELGIADRSVFDPPSNCIPSKKHTLTHAMKPHPAQQAIHKRFTK